MKTFPKSTEQIQDIVAALLVEGTGVTLAYNDGAGTLTISSSVDLTGYATTAYVDDEVSANGVSLQAFASNASNLSSGTVPIARIPTGTTGSTVALGNHTHDTLYQPLASDLTALAALSGTNTIYYRSAANTWSAVAIGTNLTFSGGTLSASGGGGGGDALTTNPLSQFAATTSAQLASVISDETGSGALVFSTSPTFTTPVLGAASATTLGVGTTSPTGLPGYSTGIEVRNTATSLPSIRVSNATRYCGLGVDGTNAAFSTNGIQFIIVTAAGGVGLSSGVDRRLWVNNLQNTAKTTSQLEVVSQVTSFVIASFCGAVSQTGDYIRCVDASNNVLFSVGATGNLTANNLTMSGSYRPGQFTVATLPSAAANTGRTVQVTDSSVDFPGNIGNTVAGGGANNVDVKSNGTNWRITG